MPGSTPIERRVCSILSLRDPARKPGHSPPHGMDDTTTTDDVLRPAPWPLWRCTRATVEVVLVFAVVHVTYRSLQAFTSYGRWEASQGLNFITGSVMVLTTVGLLLARRCDFTAYGLSPANWRRDLSIGLKWLVFTALIGGALGWLLDVRQSVSVLNQPGIRLGLASLSIQFATATLFAFVYRRQLPAEPRPAVVAINVGLFLLLAFSPLLAAACVGEPLRHTLLVLLWMGFVAGIGEEMFFRGYIQSRINEACGRPWRVLGVQFGFGLIASSLLFGFIHALNFVDYFRGQFTFAWGLGLMTIGLANGVIRERTGSIWAGTVMHILTNTLGRTALLLTAAS